MQEFEVVITGAGVPVPDPGRAGAGCLVRVGRLALQFDAGRATTMRLVEAGAGVHVLDALSITHHHSDHLVGLADLVMMRWLLHRDDPLLVVVPSGPLLEVRCARAGSLDG